jgi:hypothetical protein
VFDLKKSSLICALSLSILFISGFSYPSQNSNHEAREDNVAVESLSEFVTVFLRNETRSALNKKYDANWLFQPDVVCETGGKEIKIEGELNQNNEKSKRIIIKLVKFNSKFKVTDISESTE